MIQKEYFKPNVNTFGKRILSYLIIAAIVFILAILSYCLPTILDLFRR